MKELVSIIVPVYNAGEYLIPCLQSLCDQSYKNLEIILVDDGSTDGSGALCDEFARRDDRIRVIHQKNAGVSSARNAGLDAASGAYLTFVDADDGLVPEAVGTALRYLRENNADMVTYGWQKIFSDDGHTEDCTEAFSCTEDIPGVLREILAHYSAYGGGYPWNKLWRRNGNVPRFDPALYYFEDLEWVVRILLGIRRIVVCPEYLYRYRVHSSSVSQDPSKIERRELGYHCSVKRIIAALEVLPALQDWFEMKYAPEIVNGVIFAARNRYPKLRAYLSVRLREVAPALLHSNQILFKIKFRCWVVLLFTMRLAKRYGRKHVKIRAYAAANLGDDLFLELICARYPDVQFHLCGSKRFSKHYEKLRNLHYHSYDEPFVRMLMAGYRLVGKWINRIAGRAIVWTSATDTMLDYFYARRADANVYITGSGFMNKPDEFDSLPQKFEEELRYYQLHPYLIGCNFGPYSYKEYLQGYQKLFQETSDLCFRDSYSLALFPMVKTARRASDIVFSYPTENIETIPPLLMNPYLLISVANLEKDQDAAALYATQYVEMIRKLVLHRNSLGLQTVLLGFSTAQMDDTVIDAILNGIESPELNRVYNYPEISSQQALRLIRDASAVVATRYHAMILALLFEKKVCSICYSEKVQHVLEDIDAHIRCVSLADMAQITPEQLENERSFHIDREKLDWLIKSSHGQFLELDKLLDDTTMRS